MKTLLKRETNVGSERYGPDPVLLRKKGLVDDRPRDIASYKQRIVDESYLDHAINRIAMELSHFLVK
jgi:hypothetical protein